MYSTIVALGNRFLSVTGIWMLAFGYRWYSWPTLPTAELFFVCCDRIASLPPLRRGLLGLL